MNKMTTLIKIDDLGAVYKMKDDAKLLKLFEAFCERNGLPIYTTSFLSEGKVIDKNDTITSLGVKKNNDDVIYFTSVQPTMSAIEPITYEEITLQEWLSRNVEDNIIVIDSHTDKKFCLKRSYFSAGVVENDIYLRCIMNNNQLNIKKTIKESKVNKYIKIGYYFGEKYMMNEIYKDVFNDRRGNIFYLKLIMTKNPMTYISKESLKLSHISLMKKVMNMRTSYITKMSIFLS